MKTDNRNKKGENGSVRVSNGPSTESIIDRIVGHMTLAVILLLLGMLMRDQSGFKGFPFGWFHYPEYIKYDMLASSFLILLALTVFADIISTLVGRAKEPTMDEPTRKEPEIVTTETTVIPARREFRSNDKVRKDLSSGKTKPLLKPADIGKIAAGKKNSAKKLGPVIWVLVVISFFAVLGIDDNENYDYGTDYDDTYDYDVTEDSDFSEDVALDAMYSLVSGDYDSLSEIGDTSSIDAALDLDGTEIEPFGDPYENSDSDIEYTAYRYILYGDREDEDADLFLAGVLVENSYADGSDDNTRVIGMSIYYFRSYEEFQAYYDDPVRWFTPTECFNIGTTELEKTFVLNLFSKEA